MARPPKIPRIRAMIKIRLEPRPFKGKAPKGLIGRITGRK